MVVKLRSWLWRFSHNDKRGREIGCRASEPFRFWMQGAIGARKRLFENVLLSCGWRIYSKNAQFVQVRVAGA